MAYPELTDKQRNYPYSGNVQNPLVVPETRGTVLPTGATPEQTAQGKQNWQSNAPQQYANNPVGTVQYNIFKAMEQQKPDATTQPQGNGTGTAAGTTNSRTSSGNGATETGGTRPIRSMDDLVSAMYTDPQQEEKLRKASVANQRIMAVGDALRHIGNIFNTVNYAPSQQFNRPWEEERNRYLQEKAYRDKRNQIYMTYQQQKAAQDAKIAQAERQFQYNAAKDARDYELKKNESEARQQRQNALAALDKARLDGQLDKNTYQRLVNQYYPENAQARINEIESRIAKNNRTGGGRSGGSRGGGSRSSMPDYDVDTVYERDDEGRVIKSTKTRRVKHTDGKTSSSTKTNVGNFSIRGKKAQEEQKKTNVGNFSIHK